MENAALKIDFCNAGASEHKPLLFGFPRAFHHLENPAFVIEDHEIERLAFRLPYVQKLPYSLFLDDRGRVHFEINHSSFFPDRSWKKLFQYVLRPDRAFYDLLRTHISRGSLLKDERRLIGGMVCTYYADTQTAEIKLLGILSPEDSRDLDPEIRRKAFDILCERHRPFLKWMGAKASYSTPCIIPVAKASKSGWALKKSGLREKFKTFCDGFPMSLVKKQNIFFDERYERVYRDNSKGPGGR